MSVTLSTLFASFFKVWTSLQNFMTTTPKQLSLEEIETRIHLYRDESRTLSHRVNALTDRRKEINEKIKELKEKAKLLKS